MKWKQDVLIISNNQQQLHQLFNKSHYQNGAGIPEYNNYLDNCLLNCYFGEQFFSNYKHVKVSLKNITDSDNSTKQKNSAKVDQAELAGESPQQWIMGENNSFYFMCPQSQNDYYDFSGTDLGQLLISKEQMFSAMENVFLDKFNVSETLAPSIFTVDIQELKAFFYAQCLNDLYRMQHYISKGQLKRKVYLNQKDGIRMLSERNKDYDIDIAIQDQNIGSEISILDHSVPKPLPILCNVDNSCEKLPPTSKCVLVTGNWYFQSMLHGSMFRALLRNVNVYTVIVMRDLYFILVTDKNQNVNLQINFMLTDGMFTVPDNVSFVFSYKTVEWNENHGHVLRSTCVASFYLCSKWRHTSNLPKAIEYNMQSPNEAVNPVVKPRSQKQRMSNLVQTASYEDTDSNTSSLSADVSKSSLFVEEIAVQTNLDDLCISQDSFVWFSLMEHVMWITDLQKFAAQQIKIGFCNMFNVDSMVNETMFETTLGGFEKYYKPVGNLGADLIQNIHKSLKKVFFKNN